MKPTFVDGQGIRWDLLPDYELVRTGDIYMYVDPKEDFSYHNRWYGVSEKSALGLVYDGVSVADAREAIYANNPETPKEQITVRVYRRNADKTITDDLRRMHL